MPVETVHCSTETYLSVNPSSRPVETSFLCTGIVLFCSEFFLLVETIIETWDMSIFKNEVYPC